MLISWSLSAGGAWVCLFNPQVMRPRQQGLLVGITGAQRGAEEGGERESWARGGGQGGVGAVSHLGSLKMQHGLSWEQNQR